MKHYKNKYIYNHIKVIVCYELLHLATRKVYYGSTSDYIRRKHNHLGMLKRKNHFCKELQKDYNICPLVKFSIVKKFNDRNDAYVYEQIILDKYNNNKNLKPYLYNTATDAKLPFKDLIHSCSDETKTKISKSNKGRLYSEEVKKNMSNNSGVAKPIIIDNIKYKSAAEASRVLDIDRRSICWKLHNSKYFNCVFINK